MSRLLLSFTVTLVLASAVSAFAGTPSLVEVKGPAFVLDLRYNTPDNFLKKNVYADYGLNRCYVHSDLAERLEKLTPLLQEEGLKLILWDCYRPLDVQKAMWKLVPDARYVANPKNGSNHNRGIAVDVSLAGKDGKPLPMPTAFDDFTEKASPDFRCSPNDSEKCQNRDRLKALFARVGLRPLSTEWWHYQLPAKGYPIVPALHEPETTEN
jgi:D-alanyl-D-alanine dipeptidase